ncbi:MAG TPA: circularly permuted type 2 ATP-grasp protein, partial [Polyangiales bacterium]|nr:circularly permuted type 2 ATP-grasp protein [Polyangiales bacterium]
CDPLALRADSSLGVAGLVGAVRAGHVAVLNALGSGLTESPALLAHLPSLCKHLLGEDLILPSAKLLWCGAKGALQEVEARFDALVFRHAYKRSGMQAPVRGAALSGSERAHFLEALRAQPADWVAQDRVELSTSPVWNGTAMEPRRTIMRCYAVGHGPGYQVMPGGLTRVAASASDGSDSMLSMQRGAGSKDMWVLADGPVPQLSLLEDRAEARLALSRSGHDLPSRVADNLYWLGRYVERAEGGARLFRRVFARLWGDAHAAEPSVLHALCDGLAFTQQLRVPTTGLRGMPDDAIERLLLRELCSGDAPNSLLMSLQGAHRAASVVRDRISRDTWHVLSQLNDQRAHMADCLQTSPSEVPDALDDLILSFGAFAGLQNENLSRTFGFRFM